MQSPGCARAKGWTVAKRSGVKGRRSRCAGVVAPASGEGIYYAMVAGRCAARAVTAFLASGNPRALGQARRTFMRAHGQVFWILGIMQYFWYRDDRRRERFVTMCEDRDVQNLIWPAYMNKRLTYARPLAYLRIFVKDMRHLLQTAKVIAPKVNARAKATAAKAAAE
jgi:geranylgeranyl reductase